MGTLSELFIKSASNYKADLAAQKDLVYLCTTELYKKRFYYPIHNEEDIDPSKVATWFVKCVTSADDCVDEVSSEIAKYMRILHKEDYISDYSKCLDKLANDSYKHNSIVLYQDTNTKGELGIWNGIRYTDNYLNVPTVSVDADDVAYWVLKDSNGNYIDALTPNEYSMIKDEVNRLTGNVAICGLGIGNLVYEVAAKPDVKHVTVIEPNADLVNLWSGSISHVIDSSIENKIDVILCDAIGHLNCIDDGVYDYIYFDSTSIPNSPMPSISHIKVSVKYKKTKVRYWWEHVYKTLGL